MLGPSCLKKTLISLCFSRYMFLLLSRYRQAAALQYRFCLVCCLSDLPDFELPGIYTPNPQCGLQQQQTQHTMSYEKNQTTVR